MPIETALITTLTGSLTAFALVWGKEYVRERMRKKTDTHYLGIVVTAHLEDYVKACHLAADDDGTVMGEPAGGYDGPFGPVYHATTETPKFTPLDIKVEWKVLPFPLMQLCLDLPRLQSKTTSRANSLLGDFDDSAFEYLWRRRAAYAELGLHALELIDKLRDHAKLEVAEEVASDALTMRDRLTQQLKAAQEEVQKIDARIDAAHKQFVESLPMAPPPAKVDGVAA